MVSSDRKSSRVNRLSLNWPIAIFLIVVPLGAMISLLWLPIRKETVWFAFLYMIIRGMVITAGQLIVP